jgi:solute carrier family 25 S-adenosylmethionine transporter 26
LTTIAREEGIGALFAGSFPRLGKALLSGAIQFATYEETKQKMGEFFIKR